MPSKPHVSEALRQLRGWITLVTGVLWLCGVAQLMIFGFVHYTDVRWTTLVPERTETPLTVVGAPEDPGDGVMRVPAMDVRAGRTSAESDQAAAVEVNRVLSVWDRVFASVSGIAGTAGLIAVLMLAVLTSLGVVVAGGGSVPGVERAVTACVWSLILAMVSVPWRAFVPSALLPGVFCAYGDLTASSEAVLAGGGGGLGLVGEHFGMPMVVLVGSALVWCWFRAGVERGIIITSVSEIDELMEREMATIRSRGVAARTPRAIGALNHAIGDPETPAPSALAAGADRMGSMADVHPSLARGEPPVRGGESKLGDPLRRPI